MLPKLGRYETLSKIASGGMATVYLGRVRGEGGFERLVALKLMHPHIANDPDFVAMFLDEARLAARIRHPNVVSTIDIQKTEDSLFIVMDYVDGPTLQEIRKHLKTKSEQIPLGVTVRIFVDILNGLQEAHDLENAQGSPLNLVHRDVSPHNILIGTDGVAKLTDFGVAKAEARISSTRGGQLKGKIAYMPPEQILTEPVSRRADVYSAGVCLWEALVGKRLFRAANDGALVHMILEGQSQPPSKYVDDVPEAIEAVVMRAVSRRAEQRFAEALDMADAIEDAARDAGIRIPRAREVGGFIKEVKESMAESPVSEQSLTPASSPGSQPSGASDSGGVSQPSMPSIGTGPSHPRASDPDGPPPIPDIGSDMNMPQLASRSTSAGARPAPPPPARPQHDSPTGNPSLSPVGRRPPPPPTSQPGSSRPSQPRLSPPRASQPAASSRSGGIVPRMSYPRSDSLDDEATTVMPRELQDAIHSSAPSQVTSPTKTEATYSPLQPPPSTRPGVIAVGVMGLLAVVFVIALMLGSPEEDTTQGDTAGQAATGSPLFPESTPAAETSPGRNGNTSFQRGHADAQHDRAATDRSRTG